MTFPATALDNTVVQAAPVVTGAEDHDITSAKPHTYHGLSGFDVLP